MAELVEVIQACPFCDANLESSRVGIYWHRAKGCILSGQGVTRAEVSLWNTRPPASGVAEEAAARAIIEAAGRAFQFLRERDLILANQVHRAVLDETLPHEPPALASGNRP